MASARGGNSLRNFGRLAGRDFGWSIDSCEKTRIVALSCDFQLPGGRFIRITAEHNLRAGW
jgi:hypothetical protein